MFDILYYSNYCKYSQNVIQYIVKHQLIDKISCVSIDKRYRDHQNNHIHVVLENGQRLSLPPNVQSVPAILLVNKNHTVLFGDKQIIPYLKEKYGNPAVNRSVEGGDQFSKSCEHNVHSQATANLYSPTLRSGESLNLQLNGGEPSGFAFAAATTSGSEKFTNYHMNPEDLLSKSTSKNRDLRNYVSADHDIGFIPAPPETYKPNKLSNDITIEDLQNQREAEISRT